MPKNLLIMRHAKSSWSHSGLTDHQRPLNKRGKRDTPTMARLIADEDLVPDLVVSSTANRARMTAELFVEHCPGGDCQVSTTDEFYHASARVYLAYVAGFANTVETAMVVGHNPGLENLIESLAGEYERMPTAAIAHVIFDVDDWKKIEVENCSVQSIWRPKEI